MNISFERLLLALVAAVAAAYLLDRILRYAARAAINAYKRLCRAARAIRLHLLKIWRRIAPYLQRFPQATLYLLYVMLVSVAAPGLFIALEGYFANKWQWLPNFARDALGVALVAVFAGVSTAFLVSALRERRIKFAELVLERLSSKSKPDRDAAHVGFEPARDLAWYEVGEREYYNLKEAPRDASEWMLILRQMGDSARERYTIDNLGIQLGLLSLEVIKENNKREAEHKRREKQSIDDLPKSEGPAEPFPDDKKLKVNWVCFVSDRGRFHAFQSFETFTFDIRIRRNSRYIDLLNERDEGKFDKAIEEEIARSKDCADGQRAKIDPDVIRGLDRFWIRSGVTNEMALKIMVKENNNRAMLISRGKRHEAIGVVSTTQLAKRILVEPAEDEEVLSQASPPADEDKLYGNSAPGLAKKDTESTVTPAPAP